MEPEIAGLAILIGGGLLISYAFVCFWTCRRFATWYTGNLDAFGDKGLVFFLFFCTLFLFGWILLAIMAVQRVIGNIVAPKKSATVLAETAHPVSSRHDSGYETADTSPRRHRQEDDPQRVRRQPEHAEDEKIDDIPPRPFFKRRNRASTGEEPNIRPEPMKPKLTLAKSRLAPARPQPKEEDNYRDTAESDTDAPVTAADAGHPRENKSKKRSRKLNLNLDSRGKLQLVPGPTERKEPHF